MIYETKKSHTNREFRDGQYVDIRYICIRTDLGVEWIERSKLLIDMGHLPALDDLPIGSSPAYVFSKGVVKIVN